MLTAPIIAYVSALAATIALVPLSVAVAHRTGAVAHPRADRWNRRAVPALGGVAIFGGVVAGTALLPLDVTDRLALLVGLVIVFGIGLIDDIGKISPVARLAGEAGLGATFVWVVGGSLEPELRLAAVLLGAIAIPVAMNATNLTDNADGLAATLALVTAGTLAAAGSIESLASPNASVAIVVALSATAFLLFNRPPARVFMGDCGSLTLGFALAAVSVLLVRDALLIPGSVHVATAMAVPVAWAFQVGDLAMVVVTRWRRGLSPFSGGVDHTSHRLLAAGITPVVMIAGIGLFAGVVGASAAIAAAFFGGFRLMATVAISLLILVAAFEIMVAWRLPASGDTSVRPAHPKRQRPASVEHPELSP